MRRTRHPLSCHVEKGLSPLPRHYQLIRPSRTSQTLLEPVLAAKLLRPYLFFANCSQSGCDGILIVMMLKVIERMRCRGRM
jgi:hypothetical protein